MWFCVILCWFSREMRFVGRLTTAGGGQDGIGHGGSACDGGGVAQGRRSEHEERLGEHLFCDDDADVDVR